MNTEQEREAFEAWATGQGITDWQARAALAAKVPTDWRMVPVEPTEEMLQEAHMQVESHSFDNEFLYEVWDAMLAATPAPAPEAKPEAQQPLSDAQIVRLWESSTGHKMPNMGSSMWQLLAVARAIEQAHGIGASGEASNG